MLNQENSANNIKYNTNLINGYIASQETKFYNTNRKWKIALIMVTLINSKTGKSLGTIPVKSFIYNDKFKRFYASLRYGEHVITRVRLTPFRDKNHFYHCGFSICSRIDMSRQPEQPITNTGYLYGCIMSDSTRFYPAKRGGQIALIMVGLKNQAFGHIHGIVPVKSFISNEDRKYFFSSLKKFQKVVIRYALSPYTDHNGFHHCILSVRNIYTHNLDQAPQELAKSKPVKPLRNQVKIPNRPLHYHQVDLFSSLKN